MPAARDVEKMMKIIDLTGAIFFCYLTSQPQSSGGLVVVLDPGVLHE